MAGVPRSGMASFRGSSELEYGCDAAYLFSPGNKGTITLTCEKNRYGAVVDIPTGFDPITQAFMPAPSGVVGFDAATPARTRGKKAKGE